jgi:hypothetical protein
MLVSMNDENGPIVPEEVIMNKILFIRGNKVMIDSDLAELYGVSTKRLNEQVKRNLKRFPEDFMFQLTEKEKTEVVAKCDHLCRLRFSPHLPFAFTEHGAVMLASVLNSDRAVLANVQVVRVFTKMRKLVETHSEILVKLSELQKKETEQDRKILLIFEYLKQFEQAKNDALNFKERKRIGFRQSEDK